MGRGRFPIGSKVIVRFGIRDVEATVVDNGFNRVRVAIRLDGTTEALTTSYPEIDVRPVLPAKDATFKS